MKKNEIETIRLQGEFIHFFAILLNQLRLQKNMYDAMKDAQAYVTRELGEQIDLFLSSQASDLSIQPYLQLASSFRTDQINKVCILLYQYEKNGHHTSIMAQFLPLLEQMRENHLEAHIRHEDQRFHFYQLIPIVSVVVLTIFFALGLLSLLVVTTYGT